MNFVIYFDLNFLRRLCYKWEENCVWVECVFDPLVGSELFIHIFIDVLWLAMLSGWILLQDGIFYVIRSQLSFLLFQLKVWLCRQ